MKSKAELIILNHTKFGENSIVLHTLSSEYGRRGFLVKVSPRTAMALFLPLNLQKQSGRIRRLSVIRRRSKSIFMIH